MVMGWVILGFYTLGLISSKMNTTNSLKLPVASLFAGLAVTTSSFNYRHPFFSADFISWKHTSTWFMFLPVPVLTFICSVLW